MRKYLLFTGLIVSLFATILFPGNIMAETNNSQYATKTIEAISIKPSQLDKGFTLQNSLYVSKTDLKKFEKKFGAKLAALKNDVFSNNGKKLQINYIEATKSTDAQKVYDSLVKLVGNYNVIALKNNVVIEIISEDIKVKNLVLEKIKYNKVHKNY